MKVGCGGESGFGCGCCFIFMYILEMGEIVFSTKW